MVERDVIDVTLDGRVIEPPPTPVMGRLLQAAILVAVLAGVVGIAFLALWFALMLIPVALVAGGIAWLAWRWRLWQRG